MEGWLAYDLEIRHGIPDPDGRRETDLVYAEGWGDHAGMGVACVGIWDEVEGRYRLFGFEELEDFAALAEKRYLVGFHSRRFDDRVLAAAGIEVVTNYDIRQAWCDAHGNGFTKGTLADLVAGNLDREMYGDGIDMPGAWQRGQTWRVLMKCLEDVQATRDLFRLVLAGEPMRGSHGKAVYLQEPPW